MPRPYVGVQRRILGQGKGLNHQLPQHGLGQKHLRRMALSDRLIKVQHGSFSLAVENHPFVIVLSSA
jgi:hypothetical protein